MNRSYKNKVMLWLPLPMLGVLNGLFRGLVLNKFLTEFNARQVSSLILLILVFIYTKLIYQKLSIRTVSDAWATGIIWLVLTVGFEFTLGYLTRLSLQAMLADYNIIEGHLWPLVLLGVLVAPLLYFKYARMKTTG